jgi:lycopene beta-cyclase
LDGGFLFSPYAEIRDISFANRLAAWVCNSPTPGEPKPKPRGYDLMQSNAPYDFVFAGFGLAGMSLFHEMSQYDGFADKRVLIIDLDEKKGNDRTWSFWSRGIPKLQEVVAKEWPNGYLIARNGKQIDLELKDYRYFTVRGQDFYAFIHRLIGESPNVTMVQDRIQKVNTDGTVQCERGDYRGEMVFSSFFLREEIKIDPESVFLWQHFKGWFIRTKKPAFDPDKFLLMDYRASSDDKSDFFYVLPFSDDRALVEFTEFSNDFYSDEEYNVKIRTYLKEHHGLTDYEIEEEEFNAIPMTDLKAENVVDGRVVKIGTVAGYVKASSGYCFTRTLEKNAALAAEVMQTGKARASTTASPARYLAYDRAMLSMLASGQVHGWQMMPRLFASLRGDRVFAFLDERSTIFQDIAVMMTVPNKLAFIRFYLNRAGKGMRGLVTGKRKAGLTNTPASS